MPKLVQQRMRSPLVGGKPLDQEGRCFGGVGELLVVPLQQSANDQGVKQARQPFLRDTKRRSEIDGYCAARWRDA